MDESQVNEELSSGLLSKNVKRSEITEYMQNFTAAW